MIFESLSPCPILWVHYSTGGGSSAYTLSNLNQNTTYYVRAFATNEVGTSYGNTLRFITDTLPSDYIVTTIAGNGIAAVVNGQALSSSFDGPAGI